MKKLTGKYEQIRKIVEKELSCSAHDIDHVMRVYATVLRIAKQEKGADLDVLKVAALLHDIARAKEDDDPTGRTCHAEESAKMSEKILIKMGYGRERIERIKHCIITHRYKTKNRSETIEAKILFDADKIDSLGAISIMRSGMWMGRHGCRIISDEPLKKYVKKNLVGGKLDGRIKNPTLHNIFYEFEIKYKNVPSLMYTKTGKTIARVRLRYMDEFMKRLRKEIKGEI